jgi:uncharacterized protein (DUF1015 family)
VAEVEPFRALVFDPAAAGAPLDALVAPPYDVIPEETLHELAATSEYNVIRLIRPHEPDLAAARLADWRDRGVLVRDERPALWRLEEEFVGPDGIRRVRAGLVGRLRLHPFSDGVVFPHERTFPGPLEMRLRLIRALRTKVSPVLVLHAGPSPPPVERPPDLEATFAGATSRLWRIEGEAHAAALAGAVRGPLVIADGHHRYTAALRFHEEERTEATAFVLAALVSRDDAGLEIFPTHRTVAAAAPEPGPAFRRTPLDGDVAGALDRLRGVARDHPAFVHVAPEGLALVELPDVEGGVLERLDVAALDQLALSGVGYTPSAREAELAVRTGRARAAFLVRAPTVEQVHAVATAGLVMPQKSTYFYPKLTTGLLLSPFDE